MDNPYDSPVIDSNRIHSNKISSIILRTRRSFLFRYNVSNYFLKNSNVRKIVWLDRTGSKSFYFAPYDDYFNESLIKDELLSELEHKGLMNEQSTKPLATPDNFSNLLTLPNLESYKVTPTAEKIVYKRVEARYFNNQEDYYAEEIDLELKERYLSKELFSNLKLGKTDTTVVNIGTGEGKSVSARHLINFYAKKGYVVIIASPYIVLSNREYRDISENIPPSLTIANYLDIKNNNVAQLSKADIHIITINTLLGNPGDPDDKSKTQSKLKQNYLNGIIEHCDKNKNEVIIFFDEIHAGINNFKGRLVGNLNRWEGLVKKIFVLSATFTEASNIVLEYLSTLTKKRLTIYNCPRRKFPKQANLHIHVTKRRYTSKDLSPLNFLKSIIKEALSRNEKVNILVATQSLALAMTDPESEQPLAKYLSSLDINVIIGSTGNLKSNRFNPQRINIGTVFNTGISVEEENNTFIIITPVLIGPDSQKMASIFMEGSPAIIQALARPRNGGNIHVFMYKPTQLVAGAYCNKLPYFLKNIYKTRYIDSNEQYEILHNSYMAERAHLSRLASYSEMKNEGFYSYSLKQFILVKSQFLLASNFETFGKNVSPYIIWAACNDQFTNCTLKSINLIDEPLVEVKVSDETLNTDLKQLLSPEISTLIRKEFNDKQALNILIDDIFSSNEYEGIISNIIIWKGMKINQKQALYHPRILREILSILFELRFNENVEFDKTNYILGNILLTKLYLPSDDQRKRNNLLAAYKILDSIRKLVVYLRNDDGNNYEMIDDNIENDLCTALYELRENDHFIRYKIFSFLQGYKFNITANGIEYNLKDHVKRKKMVFKALINLFFDYDIEIKKVHGKTKRIKNNFREKELPTNHLDLLELGQEEYFIDRL